MLNKDSHKSLKRSKLGTVYDNWSSETLLQRLFLPGPVVFGVLIGLEKLLVKLLLGLFLASRLLLSSSLALVLQIESDWKLEVTLNGSALMSTVHGIEKFDIDLWSVERAIAWIDGVWLSVLIESV